jgi:hypothetical protein
MKRITPFMYFVLATVLLLGCGKEELKSIDNNQETIEETAVGQAEEFEVKEVPHDEFRVESIKREEVGEYTLIREVELENVFAENESLRLEVVKYQLNTLKPKDEYREFFMEMKSGDSEGVTILDVTLEVENLSEDILEPGFLQGVLVINNGEEIPVIFGFEDEGNEGPFEFLGKEVKEGSISAIISSDPEVAESFRLVYGNIELSFK